MRKDSLKSVIDKSSGKVKRALPLSSEMASVTSLTCQSWTVTWKPLGAFLADPVEPVDARPGERCGGPVALVPAAGTGAPCWLVLAVALRQVLFPVGVRSPGLHRLGREVTELKTQRFAVVSVETRTTRERLRVYWMHNTVYAYRNQCKQNRAFTNTHIATVQGWHLEGMWVLHKAVL